MNYAKAAVTLEKCRDLFCTTNYNQTCYGINEVNQTLIAMINFMCEPSIESSNRLDAEISRFKNRFSGKCDD